MTDEIQPRLRGQAALPDFSFSGGNFAVLSDAVSLYIFFLKRIFDHAKSMVQIQIRGVSIDFPFPPYDCQVSYMEKVIQCLQEVGSKYFPTFVSCKLTFLLILV